MASRTLGSLPSETLGTASRSGGAGTVAEPTRALAGGALPLARTPPRPIDPGVSTPIVAGYDPRTLDHAPVLFGLAMARLTGAPLIVASVQGGESRTAPRVAERDPDLVDDCSAELDGLEEEVRLSGVRVECRKLTSSSAARALHEVAEAERAGLVVVGSTRRGRLGRLMRGSTADRLLHGAACPVAAVPRDWAEHDLRTVGVGYVGSDEGRAALRGAHALARIAGARLQVIAAVRVATNVYAGTDDPVATDPARVVDDDLEREYLAHLEGDVRTAVSRLGNHVPVEVRTFVGDPADTLIRVSESLDLLVCGARRYGPLRAVSLGGVTRRVTDDARCPVIVLPRGVEAALDALVAQAPGAAART